MLKPNDLILFQGDSITDCGRSREQRTPNNPDGLGRGYVYQVVAHLLADRPGDRLRFLNMGISGNRIVDLYARWKEDALNLTPDVISILIGVNDTWHGFTRQAGVAVPKFERLYRQLLQETREPLPAVRLVLCEPFVLPCGVVTQEWIAEMDQRRAIVKQLAADFGALFVPFQAVFDAAQQQAPPQYWAADGVHPTPMGHLLMAREWMRTVADAGR